MLDDEKNMQSDLRNVFEKYGIDFSVVMNFRGAPVQGYISYKGDMAYQIVLTIRGSFADIFWFTLFHELGHLVNGDVAKTSKFIDYEGESEEETAANTFACDSLLSPDSYADFLKKGDYSISAIKVYARSQNVKPFIVIGRLQKEKKLEYSAFSNYKVRYKWAID